jgi:hypothetical protein
MNDFSVSLVWGVFGAVCTLACIACVGTVRYLVFDTVPRAGLDYHLQYRLTQILPLPHLGNRESLLRAVAAIAPGRPLGIYSVAHPPLLVACRDGQDAAGTEAGHRIETHRAELVTGRIVQDQACETLIPALTRFGDLRAALIVGGTEPVELDEHAQGVLRYLAALLEYPSALHVWPEPLRPERDCFRLTPTP